MKILFTTGTLGGGGAERNITLLANELVKKDYEISILAIWGDELAYSLDERVNYVALNPKINNKIVKCLKQVFDIRQNVKKINPDLIISFLADVNAFVLLRTRFLKCKVIVAERNDPNSDPYIKLFRVLRRIMYPYADGYVFQTPDAKKYFKNIIGNKPTEIIINPVRSDLPIHQENDSKVITTVCRLTPQKNIPMLVNAFEIVKSRYSDYKLHIYGEGVLQDELQKMIQEKDLTSSVVLKGFCKKAYERVNESEMFVLSSDYEGLSNAMLEALAMGMPVVVTDCPIGGARMMIRDKENGLLVPVGETEKFAEAIMELIENAELRNRISIEATKVRENNNMNRILNRWLRMINKVMQ